MNKKSRGFTLTELLIVVVILSILATFSLVYLRNQIFKSRDAKRKADMHLIQNAIEEYEKDHDCYPPEDPNLQCDKITFSAIGDGLIPYLSKVPCDPISGKSYPYESGDPAICPKWFRMYTLLETGEYIVSGPGGSNYDYYVASPNAPTPLPVASTAPTSSPTSTPAGSYWGCIGGVCEPVTAPYCAPKFTASHCSWSCTDINGDPINECR